MTKRVLISISGMQMELDSEDTVEVMCRGRYYQKNGKHYVLFDQMDEETPTQVTKNTIKIAPDQVDMIKKGASSVHMVFAKGQNNLTYYNTPFGQMLMGVNTKNIEVSEDEGEIVAKLTYGLDVNYSHMSDCEVNIRIRECV